MTDRWTACPTLREGDTVTMYPVTGPPISPGTQLVRESELEALYRPLAAAVYHTELYTDSAPPWWDDAYAAVAAYEKAAKPRVEP